jgi:hypothetical protein
MRISYSRRSYYSSKGTNVYTSSRRKASSSYYVSYLYSRAARTVIVAAELARITEVEVTGIGTRIGIRVLTTNLRLKGNVNYYRSLLGTRT